jgi:3-hydroxyanthranilate 3,4-dioxygenase
MDRKPSFTPTTCWNKICIKNLELHCNACCRANARKDYHYNETEELFYQLEAPLKLLFKRGCPQMELREHVFASCQCSSLSVRSAGSIGLVIERKRVGERITDGLLWHCDNCNHKLYEVKFELKDIEKISCRILNISITQLP